MTDWILFGLVGWLHPMSTRSCDAILPSILVRLFIFMASARLHPLGNPPPRYQQPGGRGFEAVASTCLVGASEH